MSLTNDEIHNYIKNCSYNNGSISRNSYKRLYETLYPDHLSEAEKCINFETSILLNDKTNIIDLYEPFRNLKHNKKHCAFIALIIIIILVILLE